MSGGWIFDALFPHKVSGHGKVNFTGMMLLSMKPGSLWVLNGCKPHCMMLNKAVKVSLIYMTVVPL